jgi:hypothetical protein
MITIEQTTEELLGAVVDLLPEHAFGEWRRNIFILVDTPPNVVLERPSHNAREILIRLGEDAMDQYRAAKVDSRKERCAVLRDVVFRRMDAYDLANDAITGEKIHAFVIDGADAIVD